MFFYDEQNTNILFSTKMGSNIFDARKEGITTRLKK